MAQDQLASLSRLHHIHLTSMKKLDNTIVLQWTIVVLRGEAGQLILSHMVSFLPLTFSLSASDKSFFTIAAASHNGSFPSSQQSYTLPGHVK